MTHRTEGSKQTPIEQATMDTVLSIGQNAVHFYREYQVERQNNMTRGQFLRILALYLHDKSLTDWCLDLGIPDAADPSDKPNHEQDRR